MSRSFQEEDRVRFSPEGAAKVHAMPEAWGLHTALRLGETGEVVAAHPAEEDLPAQLSVEFPSGGAYNWDAACFEPAGESGRREEET
jgi:hypothetical protein